MNKELRILAQKHRKFQEDTGLALSVIWNENNEYDPFEVQLVNNSLVEDYFKNPTVKEHLTCVDGVCKNKNGVDVRNVAQNYIQHFKLVHEVKPMELS